MNMRLALPVAVLTLSLTGTAPGDLTVRTGRPVEIRTESTEGGTAYRLRPETGDSIHESFRSVAAESPRVRIFRYGASHEGRPLFYAAVGSAENMERLDELKSEWKAAVHSSDPLTDSGVDRFAFQSPAVVWIGAAVHGDEPSGADAAGALLRHLAFNESEETRRILSETIVLIDPLQNPDGRARFIAESNRWRGKVPDRDDQSVPHRKSWPSPRGNHYFLNLNRDWFALTQPESRARVALLAEWAPAVTFDLHEMRDRDGYLFSPPREPYHRLTPETTFRWWDRFALSMASEFGAHGWSCYTGDWNEEFNPNRGAAWPLHTGAIALLGEQANAHGTELLQPAGTVLRYGDAVQHHFTAALTLLGEVARSRTGLLKDFLRARRGREARGGAGEPRCFVIDGGGKIDLARRLASSLAVQGIGVTAAGGSFRMPKARNYYGEERGNEPFPAGSYLVDGTGPGGRLARALLDFDPHLDEEFLVAERNRIERGEGTLLYESSAWSPAMAYGVDVYASPDEFGDGGGAAITDERPRGAVTGGDPVYAYLLDSNGEGAVRAAAALFNGGVVCRAVPASFTADGKKYGAGSIVVERIPNETDLAKRLETIASSTGATFHGVPHALTSEGPDLGSTGVRVLRTPRVALLAGPPFYETTFGALWHWIDVELGLPCSRIRTGGLATIDLDRYNLIVVPDAAPGRGLEIIAALGEEGIAALNGWIARGGTLITLGEGNWILFGIEEPVSSLRALRQLSGDGPDEDERIRRFHPDGAILRADLERDHWLAAGAGERVPVMVRTDLALVSDFPAEPVGRFAGPDSIRLSGLLWPEARDRWAETSWLSRERIGRGQVIAFLGNPVYRTCFYGTGRLFSNALLLGPGLGTAEKTPY